ncbi:MAG: hypothetical protein LUQ07_07350 [Methanospirillum sp.]|nr:hypothetical protein [Methanospirillum sp.]
MKTRCDRCSEPAVLFQRYSGRYLCAAHLAEDIISRVKRTIRAQGGLGRKNRFVLIPGGDAFILLVYLFGQITGMRPDTRVVILNTGGYVPELSVLTALLPPGVRVQVQDIPPEKTGEVIQAHQADRILSAESLEESAALVLGAILTGNSSSLVSPPVHHEYVHLFPLREIPEEEIDLLVSYYALPGAVQEKKEPSSARLLLDALVRKHPSVPFSVIRYADRLQNCMNQQQP